MNTVVTLQYYGIKLTKILPYKVADKIATVIGLLFCHLSKKKRSYIQRNLEHIFYNQDVQPEQMNRYVKNTFINFARMMVDFFRLCYMTKDDFDVEPVGVDNCLKALALGRGCVLLTLHLGNWDYAGAFLAANGVPMNALVEVTESEMLDLYTKHRESTGMKTFPITKSGYAFLDAIKNNRVIAVLADRDIAKNGITIDFFSGQRSIPRGLAEIIIKKKIPVVFAYIVFNPPGKKHRYRGVVEPPIVFDGTAEDFNKLMVAKFESYIKQYPDQWLVFHPEWIES